MTTHTPIDAFASIDLNAFKKTTPKKSASNKQIDEKELVKQIAAEKNFQSRQVPTQKPKVVTKTFSLFQEDCQIIQNVLKNSMNYGDGITAQPSGSDVVRAALHSFAKESNMKQLEIIEKLRGRGRK